MPITFFESLKQNNHIKSEMKVLWKFNHILIRIEKREFSIWQIQSIESELEKVLIKIETDNRKR
jgi:hypothetical protein